MSSWLCQWLREGFVVGVIGLVADKPLATKLQEAIGEADCLDVTGYTKTVRELMVLFHLADLLVTNDGGPGHFAAMTPVPSIILYGPETPVLYGSLQDEVHHFYLNLSCSPCVMAYNHRASPCDGDNQCLKRITPRGGDPKGERAHELEPRRRVVFYIESRRFLIRDSPRPATTYEQKTGGADGVKGA